MLSNLPLLVLPLLPVFALEPVEVAEIKNPKSDNADFGTALAWSADRLFVGAPYIFDNPELLSGAANAFEIDTWLLKQPIQYPDDGLTFLFGSAVVVLEDRLIVGAPAETVGGKATAGAVYTLNFDGALWNDMAAWKLNATVPEIGQRFGQSLAYDGKQLIVGVPGANTAMNKQSDAGQILVYEPNVDGWTLKQTLFSMTPLEGAEMGHSLALSGDRLVVSAPEGVSPMHVVFERDGNLVWAQKAVITPTSLVSANCAMDATSMDISTAIGLQGDAILVGSPQNSELASGAVSVLKFENNQWRCQQRLDPDSDTAESFGFSIATRDDLLFVGAVGNSDIDINNGAIYTFERDVNTDTYTLPPRKTVGKTAGAWLGSVMSSQGPYLAAQVNAQHMSGEPSVYIYEIRPSLGETCDGVLPCAVGVCSDGLCCSEECTGTCFHCTKETEPDPGTCEFVADAPCSDGDRGCVDGMCQQAPDESSTGASGTSETSGGHPTTGADDTSTGPTPTTSAGTDGSDSSETTSASSGGVGFDPDTLFGCTCQGQGDGRDKTHEVLGVVVVMLTVRRRRR